jgi:hypothetical protein
MKIPFTASLQRLLGRYKKMIADCFTAMGTILIPLSFALQFEWKWMSLLGVLLGIVSLTYGLLYARHIENQEREARNHEHEVGNNRFLLERQEIKEQQEIFSKQLQLLSNILEELKKDREERNKKRGEK